VKYFIKTVQDLREFEEWRLLGCYAVRLLHEQEPHGVAARRTPFFIITDMKTSKLTEPEILN
jgi:hypothetical protein